MKETRIGIFESLNPFMATEMARGAAEYARLQKNWRVVWSSVSPASLVQTASFLDVSGAVLCNLDESAGASRISIPTVQTMHQGDRANLWYVGPDEVAVGRLAARHLIDRGFAQFAVCGVDAAWSIGRDKGFYQEVLLHRGVESIFCQHSNKEAVLTWEKILDAGQLKKWVKKLPARCGVLAVSDMISTYLIDAALSLGRAVPEDIAVVGVDNDVLRCDYHRVPMSSVRMNSKKIGFEAARLLHEQLKGRKQPMKILVPPDGIEVRRSSDVLAVDDPDIVAAMKFIRLQAAEGIKVEDVLRHVAVSRSWLDRRLKQITGRTCSDEIERVRLDLARDLLLGTDLPLYDVAQRCGYGYLSHFSHAITRAFGTGPRAFRAKHRRSA
jgi:LacI family transcriptional regulator